MTPELLQTALSRALASFAAARGIGSDRAPDPTLRRPKQHGRGDWTSTIALRGAATVHADPRFLAEELAEDLRRSPGVAAVDVSGPGFLNITVSPDSLARRAVDIAAAGREFGPDAKTATTIEAAVTERIAGSSELASLRFEVGTDALRFFAASTTSLSPPVCGSRLLRTAHRDNAVHFVQTAHAAACRIERRAVWAGVPASGFDPLALTDRRETALLATLTDFLATTGRAASSGEPQRITGFLGAVSELVFDWANACTVTPTIDEDITSLHASRLVLDRAAITVLATGLRLLGVSAPERM